MGQRHNIIPEFTRINTMDPELIADILQRLGARRQGNLIEMSQTLVNNLSDTDILRLCRVAEFYKIFTSRTWGRLQDRRMLILNR